MSSYRQICLDSKGESCTICHSTENIVAHHIDSDRTNNELDNLVPVCRSCHGKIHTGAPGYEEWHEKLPQVCTNSLCG